MKKIFFSATLLLAALSYANAQDKLDIPYVSANGEAKVEVAPNKIVVQVTLSEADSKGKITIKELEAKFSTALKQANVDSKKQLALLSQSSSAVKRVDSYQYKKFELWVSNAQELTILFNALQNNEIQNARVSLITNTNMKAINDSLIKQAVVNAQQTARLLVEPLGQSIGEAIAIDAYMRVDHAVYGGNNMIRGTAKTVAADNSPSPLMDETNIKPFQASQSVTVRFRLKP